MLDINGRYDIILSVLKRKEMYPHPPERV